MVSHSSALLVPNICQWQEIILIDARLYCQSWKLNIDFQNCTKNVQFVLMITWTSAYIQVLITIAACVTSN